MKIRIPSFRRPNLCGLVFIALSLAPLAALQAADTFLVANGQPRAEILIPEKPTRMQKLAAEELQAYVEKISGARLIITSSANDAVPVKIYVGRSPHTDRLKISTDGLQSDAFRMISGRNWLALVGDDADYIPRDMDALKVADRSRIRAAFNARTAPDLWEDGIGPNMDRALHSATGWWQADRRGSLNAVYEFLRSLGVRWYMPGELGEVVPDLRTIPLPVLDKTVRPDFELRHHNLNRYDLLSREDILWHYRLGLNHGRDFYGHTVRHGLQYVHRRPETPQAHPEYYAVWGGKRQTGFQGVGAPCLSSEDLFQATVRYARSVFDIYDEPMVDISVVDNLGKSGFRCECAACQAQYTPDRPFGVLSDYVWGFVNRVAREVHKTHPKKFISSIAYQNNILPPEKIDKLSPNLVVCISNGWRSVLRYPELRSPNAPHMDTLRRAWQEKVTSGQMFVWDYYLHSRPHRGEWPGVPVYFMRSIAEDLRAIRSFPEMKGEHIEVTRNESDEPLTQPGTAWGPRGALYAPGFNHLNLYVTARLYWGVSQDLDAILEEYYRLFYGPAAAPMKAFIEHAEINWPKMSSASKDVKPVDDSLALLAAAREAAGDGVYGQRIDLMVEYTQPLKRLRETMARTRSNVPRAEGRLGSPQDAPKIDGVLDDAFWARQSPHGLRAMEQKAKLSAGTTFRVGWAEGAIYFGIECAEPDMAGLKITDAPENTTEPFAGDTLELLIETTSHSYYQISINPEGRLVDFDRGKGVEPRWESNAKVAVHRGKTQWTVEVMIPVNENEELVVNPLQGVVGRMPTRAAPWHFNLGRQRVRGMQIERSSFSPTNQPDLHVKARFAELTIR